MVTFDCYGTLIDWETGIGEAFHEALTGVERKTVSAKKLVALSDEEERRVEKEKPYKSYREVQSLAVKTIARKIDWSHPDPDILSEALPRWKPFPDTNPSLKRLAKSYTLGILSNVDNDLLAATLTQQEQTETCTKRSSPHSEEGPKSNRTREPASRLTAGFLLALDREISRVDRDVDSLQEALRVPQLSC